MRFMRVAWRNPFAAYLTKKVDFLAAAIFANISPSGKRRFTALTGAIDVYVPPPNSYGLLLLLQLELLERQDLSTVRQNSRETLGLQLEAQAQALSDGGLWIADAESFDRIALDAFLRDYPESEG